MPRHAQTQAMKEQAALRVTWLGETTALVELRDRTTAQARASAVSSPPSPTNKSSSNSNSINVLFNPVLEQHSYRLIPQSPSSLWNILACSSTSSASSSKATATALSTSHAQSTALSKRLEGLPDVHYVFISESHFSNLDVASVLTLVKRDASKFFVPKGWITHLESIGVPSYLISEFSDWQEETIQFSPSRSLRVTALPTHSATATNKEAASSKKDTKNRRLGQSAASANWLVEAGEAADVERKTGEEDKFDSENNDEVVSPNTTRVFYAGGSSQRPKPRSSQPDTSVEAFFEEISDRLAPVDLALVPVWAGLSATSNSSSSIFGRIFGRKSSGSKGKATMQPEYKPAASIDLHRLLKTQVTVALLHGLPNVAQKAPKKYKKTEEDDDDDDSDNKPRGLLGTPEARNVIARLKAACDRSEGRSVEFRRNSLARRGSKGVAGGSRRTSVVVGSSTTTTKPSNSRRASGEERPPSASRRSSGSGSPFVGQGTRRGKSSFVVLDLGQNVSM